MSIDDWVLKIQLVANKTKRIAREGRQVDQLELKLQAFLASLEEDYVFAKELDALSKEPKNER